MAAYTTSNLLADIGLRSFAPTGQVTFQPAELLSMADQVVVDDVVPAIMRVREEFFVYDHNDLVVADRAGYSIPARAIGLVLRDLWIIDGSTVTTDFPRIEPEDAVSAQSGEPTGFYVKANRVVLYPTPASGGKTIRQQFFLSPSRFVETSAAAVISAIDPVTKTVTASSLPSTWVTGNALDLIRQDGGYEPLAIDQTADLISGTSVTFAELPFDLRVGDYLALAGETPLVQLPREFQAVIAQGTAAEVLEAMNQPGADVARKKFEKMLEKAVLLLSPRVQGAERVIRPLNWF